MQSEIISRLVAKSPPVYYTLYCFGSRSLSRNPSRSGISAPSAPYPQWPPLTRLFELSLPFSNHSGYTRYVLALLSHTCSKLSVSQLRHFAFAPMSTISTILPRLVLAVPSQLSVYTFREETAPVSNCPPSHLSPTQNFMGQGNRTTQTNLWVGMFNVGSPVETKTSPHLLPAYLFLFLQTSAVVCSSSIVKGSNRTKFQWTVFALR